MALSNYEIMRNQLSGDIAAVLYPYFKVKEYSHSACTLLFSDEGTKSLLIPQNPLTS